jgi:ABC-type multidrug transport system fused ATPase/permease subunit
MYIFSNFLNLYNFLTFKNKILFSILVFFLLITSILDAVGVALIIPFFDLLLERETSFFTSLITNFFKNFYKDKQLTLVFVIFILLFYSLKSLVISFANYLQYFFVFKIQSNIKINIFKYYINLPYKKFLDLNSSKITNLVTQDLHLFIFNFMVPLLVLIAETLIILSILVLFMIINPLNFIFFLVIFLLFLILFFFLKLSTKKHKYWGEKRESLDEQSLKIFQNALTNIKITKINNKIDYFVNDFSNKVYLSSKLQSFFYTILQLPRIFVELLIIFLLLLSYYILSNSGSNHDTLVSLALLTAGAFRIAPSINRVMLALQSLKYSQSTFTKVYSFLHREKKITKNNTFKNIIFKNSKLTFKNINFSYKKQKILNNISLDINAGEFVAIIGKSGSGKSTLLDLLSGILIPTSGYTYLNNQKIKLNNFSWQKNIGYVTQSNILLDENIYQNISFGTKVNKILINEILSSLNLKNFINSENKNLGEKGLKISGGQAQRISLARALYLKPQILLIDEGTNALDAATEKVIMNFLYAQKRKITVIFVSHRNNILNKCDKIYEIKNNKIFLKKNKL